MRLLDCFRMKGSKPYHSCSWLGSTLRSTQYVKIHNGKVFCSNLTFKEMWLDIPAFSEFNVLRINIYWRRKYRTLCLEHSELNSGGRNTFLVLIKGCFCGLNWSWALQIPGDVSWKIIYAVNTLLDEVERFSWKKLEIVWIYLAHR